MEFTFTFTTDTVIALIALVLAVGSSLYTWYANRYSIELFHAEKEIIYDNILISFSVANTSSRPIRIKSIKLLSDSTEIEDNHFDPIAYEKKLLKLKAEKYDQERSKRVFGDTYLNIGINPYSLELTTPSFTTTSDNFSKEVFLLPSEECSFSYFVNEVPSEVIVNTNQKINRFKNKKSFFVNFYEHNEID